MAHWGQRRGDVGVSGGSSEWSEAVVAVASAADGLERDRVKPKRWLCVWYSKEIE